MTTGILGRLASSGQALAAGLFARAPARRRFSLAGKNALVIGGARGLGLEIARVLVAKRANVAIVAGDGEEVQGAVDALRDTSPNDDARIVGEVCDLHEGDAIAAMLARVRSRVGPVDVLVNDAGSIQAEPLDALRVEDLEEAMTLHCIAPFRTMIGVRADMRTRGGGRIANVSRGGMVSLPRFLPYSASKFALVGLSQGMHAELAGDDIVVSTIAPGLMRTPLPRTARRVVRAIERGETHVVVGFPAKVAAFASGVAPGAVVRALTFASAALPDVGHARN
jgi:NAD(P)-dependent dehydrogenase (short-subunit alcohol dehydrogenase family)